MVHVPAQQASALTRKVLASAKTSARCRPGPEPPLRPFEPSSHRMAATEKPRTPASAGVARWHAGPLQRKPARWGARAAGWMGAWRRGDGPYCWRSARGGAGQGVGQEASGGLRAWGIGTGDRLLRHASRCGDVGAQHFADYWPRQDHREERGSTQAGERHRVHAYATGYTRGDAHADFPRSRERR